MKISKKQASTLYEAIEQWQQEALLDEPTADRLKNSVQEYTDDFGSLSFYAFIAAISCAILAFGALVLDEKWIERMRKFFEFSEFVIGLIFAVITVLFVWIIDRRKKKYPNAFLANESFTVLIALSGGVAVAYTARGFGINFHYYGLAIFAAALVYGIIAYRLQSKLLWVCMLLALISSWAAQTYAWSANGSNSYFLGMNYPLRMTVFGMIIITASFLLKKNKKLSYFFSLTYYSGWVFFLLSALFLSVSGNLNYDVWAAIRQGELFIWALAYTILLIGLLMYVIKTKDETLRDIVIVFFLLNIYTRYFEYFWDRTNKGLFFAILALSFWLIGRKAEQMRKKIIE